LNHVHTDAFNRQNPDNRHFRDYPITGHVAGMPNRRE
jgi:hypothetical protein